MSTKLKLFLTSGLTLSVDNEDTIHYEGRLVDVHELFEGIKKEKYMIEFNVELEHEGKLVHHDYAIPHDRLSWAMVEVCK